MLYNSIYKNAVFLVTSDLYNATCLPLQLSLACIFYIPSVTWYALLFNVTPYIAVFLLHRHLCYIKSICPQEHINSHFVQGSTRLLLASCYLFTSTRNTSDFILFTLHTIHTFRIVLK